MPEITAIKALWKRCAHFAGRATNGRHRGGWSGRVTPWLRWQLPVDHIAPEGMGLIAHNYALMQGADDTTLERLLWADALAQAFNRYIDAHLIAGDRNAVKCLKWWRRQVIADPTHL